MTKSLKKQLIQYFIFFTIILSSLYILTTLSVVRQTFNTYKISRTENTNLTIVSYIESNYSLTTGYDTELIRNLIMYAQQNALDLTLYNSDREQIWSQTYKMGHMNHMNNMSRKALVTKEYPLKIDSTIFGYLRIQQSSDSVLSSEDSFFLRSLFIGVILATLFGFFIAVIVGLLFSKKLSKPLVHLKNSAQEIENGHLSLRIKDKSNITEYLVLSNAINDMSATLEQQRTLRTTLANNISHELRTPLYIMKTHIEALSDGILEPSNETYMSINSEIDHLTHIVSDIEQLTALDETITLNIEAIDLNTFMKTLLRSYEGIIQSEDKRLEYECVKDILINCDQKRLRQIFTNLMSNALKFTETGDTISIKIKKEYDSLIIIFKDTGIGISQNNQNYIFERFYKITQKNKSKTDGAGLGLSIVKEIVSLHQGTIEVTSVENSFTEFIIKLPLTLQSS